MISVAFDTSAFDPRFKSHAQRGIGRYARHVAEYLTSHQDPEVSVSWFDHDSLLTTGFATRAIDLLPCARQTLRQQLLYPLKLSRGALKSASCIHFPAHMDGPAWCPKPYILTVHDLIPLILEPLYRAHRPNWRFEFARWLENTSIRNALLLLAVSETTANDVTRILGIPRERIVVTPNGVEDNFFDLFDLRRNLSCEARDELRGRLRIPRDRKIILYVGGHDERKNIRAVVEISREVIIEKTSRGETPPVLVLAGKINSEREKEVLHTALRDFAMASDTIDLGYVSESDLRSLYAESSCFLFPSLYEGFGLPVLEASAAGVPVVSSDRGALPEVLGDTGLLFNPEDSIGGATAVLSILNDPVLSERLSCAGHAHAREYSWERTGKLTLEAYRYAGALLTQASRGGRISHPSPQVENSLAQRAGNAG